MLVAQIYFEKYLFGGTYYLSLLKQWRIWMFRCSLSGGGAFCGVVNENYGRFANVRVAGVVVGVFCVCAGKTQTKKIKMKIW